MKIEQRLDQLERRNRRLTAALTLMAVAICEADRRLVGTVGTSIGQLLPSQDSFESGSTLPKLEPDTSQILGLVDSNRNDFWPASLKIPQETLLTHHVDRFDEPSSTTALSA